MFAVLEHNLADMPVPAVVILQQCVGKKAICSLIDKSSKGLFDPPKANSKGQNMHEEHQEEKTDVLQV